MIAAVLPAHRLDPGGDLLGVRHRRREAHEGHLGREVDDDLLPHRPAVAVLQVVHLVEHDVLQAVEGGRRRVDHVAQHLRGHHHDRCVAVHRVVTGEQAHGARSVAAREIAVLLVRQRLQRRGVEDLPARGERALDRVLRDQRLARARRRCHQHAVAGVEGVERALLELVEGEAAPGLEGGARRGPTSQGVDDAGVLVAGAVVVGLAGRGRGGRRPARSSRSLPCWAPTRCPSRGWVGGTQTSDAVTMITATRRAPR